MELKGKTALITGSSRGIGKAIAERFASQGANVIIHYSSNKEAADATLHVCREYGVNAASLCCNLSDSTLFSDFHSAIFSILDTWNTKLDILVNNAASYHKVDLYSSTTSQFDEMVNVNLKAPYFLVQSLVHRMNEGGRIINIGSHSASRAFVASPIYGMTKAALNHLTLSLSQGLATRTITVNGIIPVLVDTDLIRQDETARQHMLGTGLLTHTGADIADIALMLVSPLANNITGHNITCYNFPV